MQSFSKCVEEYNAALSTQSASSMHDLTQLLNTFATECQLYVDLKDYAKSIRVVEQITMVCSVALPTAMAESYSLSLLYVGRSADALEVIDSLGILEDYSPDLNPLVSTIASALCDCHLVDKALEFVALLLSSTPTPASVFELAYKCYRSKGDEEKTIEYLTKALAALDANDSGKKQELALLLSQLYDERGELLKSVEVTSKYLVKSRHLQVWGVEACEA